MDITLGWNGGQRISVRGRGLNYWVQIGTVRSNTTWNPRHALRWGCRIRKALADRNVRVLTLTFRKDDRYYEMGYRDDS